MSDLARIGTLWQPYLSGSIVTLRPLAPGDFDALYAVACDPLVWKQHPASNRWQREVFQDFFRMALESRGALLASDAIEGRTIGSSRFNGYDERRSKVEIGWTFLARSHWGGRYNAEMKRLMLDHAFGIVETVIFTIGSQNRRSQRAIEKIGARHTSSRFGTDGGESFVYAIERPLLR